MSGSIKNEMPLVTFVLFAYNQEKFIREAVEGAFAQDYEHLEIILSDDGSSDNTFFIMKEMADKYLGKHQVILNRNDQNLGLAAHINKVMKIVHSDLIVAAAGDDVSLPNRVSEIVYFYINNDKPDSIFSDYYEIYENGDFKNKKNSPKEQTLEDFINMPLIKGAAHAWSTRVFKNFGDISNFVLSEDIAIPFRAYFLNKPRYLDKKLIKYRQFVRNNFPKIYYYKLTQKRILTSNLQFFYDLKNINKENKHINLLVRKNIKNSTFMLDYWSKSKIQSIFLTWRIFYIFNFKNSLKTILKKILL